MSRPLIDQMKVGHMENYAYIIGCPITRVAALVDPAFETNRLLARLDGLGLKLEYILCTHGHSDHIGGNLILKGATGARIVAHDSATHAVDLKVGHDEIIKVGKLPIRCLHTPGHSPDGLCFVVAETAVITGDTLFVGECGRTDLPGSDPRALYNSFFKVLVNLPDELIVYPGHDYGSRPHSTMGLEKKTNYTLEPRTLEDFVKFMAEP